MVEELSITELDMVSGGAANSVDWNDVWDVGVGAAEMAYGGFLMATLADGDVPGAIEGASLMISGAGTIEQHV